MAIICNEELRRRISINIPRVAPYNVAKRQKLENIDSFNALSRDGLENGVKEYKILLYKTLVGEKIYMQYPGSESKRDGNRRFLLDARPVLQKADGSYLDDLDFKKIWDIIDRLGYNHRANIDILATIFLRIAYMLEYQHHEEECLRETIDIKAGTVINTDSIQFIWNALYLDSDVVETLNNLFGEIGEGISIEGFLYYNDLLAQNEDCKYSCLKGEGWNVKTGRINNCLTHLTLISHLREKMPISELIARFRSGVAPLPQKNLGDACGELVKQTK